MIHFVKIWNLHTTTKFKPIHVFNNVHTAPQAILCYYNTFNPPTRLTSMCYSYVGSNGKCSLVWDCPAEGAVIHLNYTEMSVYILKCSWAGLVCLQIALPPATGLVETYEVKEIKARFTRSEVSCGQILDHECIEWTTSELNINHLELGRQDACLPGRLGPEPRHPNHRPCV